MFRRVGPAGAPSGGRRRRRRNGWRGVRVRGTHTSNNFQRTPQPARLCRILRCKRAERGVHNKFCQSHFSYQKDVGKLAFHKPLVRFPNCIYLRDFGFFESNRSTIFVDGRSLNFLSRFFEVFSWRFGPDFGLFELILGAAVHRLRARLSGGSSVKVGATPIGNGGGIHGGVAAL